MGFGTRACGLWCKSHESMRREVQFSLDTGLAYHTARGRVKLLGPEAAMLPGEEALAAAPTSEVSATRPASIVIHAAEP